MLSIPQNVTPFDRRYQPGRGQGYFANRFIPRGTRLLTEPVLFPIENAENPLSRANKQDIVDHVASLFDPELLEFLRLFCPSQLQPNDINRFNNNNFQSDDNVGAFPTRRAIFVQASRFNHSCAPNAHYSWNERFGYWTIHTIRDIQIHEEIFLDYHGKNWDKISQVRKDALRRDYHFTCTCSRCRPNTHMRNRSDMNRREMKRLNARIALNRHDNHWEARHQLRQDIIHLREFLNSETLEYPLPAILYRKEAEFLKREQGMAHKVIELSADKGDAIRATQKELFLHLIGTGRDAEEFQDCLDFMKTL